MIKNISRVTKLGKREKEGVGLVLLIIGLVEVSSGALVNVAAITIKDVVGFATALWLFSDEACGRSF